jgi:cardiolipin synthase
MHNGLFILRRSLRVQIITNSKSSNSTIWYPSAAYFRELIQAGVEVYEWQGDQSIHAKTMIIDGELALVGSLNLGVRSMNADSEVLMLSRDSGTVAQLQEAWDRDILNTEPASHQFTIGERILIAAARLFEPIF